MAMKIVTRGKLKSIYDGLSNQEKNTWSDKSGYSNYKGLYRYISNSPDEEAYTRVVNGLFETVGQVRFNELINNNGQLSIEHVLEFKRELKEALFKSNDVQFIENVRNNIETMMKVCNNQLDRLALEEE